MQKHEPGMRFLTVYLLIIIRRKLMNKYNCFYDNGTFNCINDNIYADSVEEAKRLFVVKWGVANPDAVRVTGL